MNLKTNLTLAATTIGLVAIPSASFAAIIGVDFGQVGSSTPTNWNLVTGAGTTTSLIDETGVTTAVDISVSSTGPVSNFNTGVQANTIPTHSNPLGNIGESIYDGDFARNVATITFSDLVPNQTYSYWLFGLREFGPLGQNVVVNGVSFNQSAVLSGELVVNSVTGNSNQTLQSYAIPITSNALGQITTTITPDIELFGVAGIAIEIQDIPPTPEPSSVLALLGLGLGALASRRKKQA